MIKSVESTSQHCYWQSTEQTFRWWILMTSADIWNIEARETAIWEQLRKWSGKWSLQHVCVCAALCYDLMLGNHYSPGVSSQPSQGSTHPRFRIAGVPPHLVLTQTTVGGQILTLRLNYVAGYTSPLLSLFEWIQQLTPSTARDKLWRLCIWASQMFFRTHRWSVCVALFYWTDTGESLRSRGFITSEPRGIHPRSEIVNIPPLPP